MKIHFEAWCENGFEETVVAAFHGHESRKKVIDQLIEDEITAFGLRQRSEKRDLAKEFYEFRKDLEKVVQKAAKLELGLIVVPTIVPRLEGDRSRISIETGIFSARPRDSELSVKFECTSEVQIDPERRALALLAHRDVAGIQERFRRLLINAIESETSLQELAQGMLFRGTGSDSPEVERSLIRHINKELLSMGRRVSFLQLAAPKLSKPEMLQMDYEVSCPIRDGADSVTVKHRLLMIPIDLGQILRSRISDPGKWIEGRLERHTQAVLFQKTYRDLLLSFDSSEIKEIISEEARRVGYEVQQMVSIPDLEPLTWRDGLSVECGVHEFATGDSRIRVKLDIVVNGRIESLDSSRVLPYLGPGSTKIKEDIKKEAVRAAQKVMHFVDPRSFYLGFRNSGDPKVSSVAEDLERGIQEALMERFALSDVYVASKPHESKLTDRIKFLGNGPHRADVECLPLRSGGRREAVRFWVEFDILGVPEPCWHIFYARKDIPQEEELEKIRTVLRNSIRSRLETIPADRLQYQSRKSQRIVAESLALVGNRVYESFGLQIRILDVYRDATPGEKHNLGVLQYDIEEGAKQGQLVTTTIHKATESRLSALLEKEKEMLLGGYEDDDPELESLRERIQEIRKENLPYRDREERDHVPRLPQESRDFSLEDYREDLLPPALIGALPGSGDPKRLEEEDSGVKGE